MKIENLKTYGLEDAIRAMRNPYESHYKSDSFTNENGVFLIGKQDSSLCLDLINAGTEHRKFLRQAFIIGDFTLPRYVWTEFDTYKVGVTRNSSSTMHLLGKRPLTQDDFEYPIYEPTLAWLNLLSEEYRGSKGETKEELKRKLKNELPEGFLQMATVSMNYEVALNILRQRSYHRLPEWRLDNKGSICWTLYNDVPYLGILYNALNSNSQGKI